MPHTHTHEGYTHHTHTDTSTIHTYYVHSDGSKAREFFCELSKQLVTAVRMKNDKPRWQIHWRNMNGTFALEQLPAHGSMGPASAPAALPVSSHSNLTIILKGKAFCSPTDR